MNKNPLYFLTAFVLLTGCQSSNDPATEPPATISTPETTEGVHPTNVTPPPPAITETESGLQVQAGFGDGVEPGVLRLLVTNQSFEVPSVKVTIQIDGETVVDDTFDVESQHNVVTFDVSGLTPGLHEVTVESDTGITAEQTVTMEDAAKYVFVSYWSQPGQDDGFEMYESVEEPMFS